MSEGMYAQNILIGTVVIALIIGAGIGYGTTQFTADDEDSTAVSGKLKAGFIYVGPIGDLGWTNAHDNARVALDEKYDWLETNFLESVAVADTITSIEFLIEDWGADVIFTTSFDYMANTILAGERWPDTIFFHISGFMRSANVGTLFADFYQLYYLNGLMAGALTQTNQLGYVGSFEIPELVRHIDAFHLGAMAVNPDVTTHVRWISSWYDPGLATAAATELLDPGIGADILAFTEDSESVLQAASAAGAAGFSHYSPMQELVPDATISGQLVHWDVIYEDALQKVFLGDYTNKNLANVDVLGLLKEGAVELGGAFDVPINPLFVDDLKAVNVTDALLGGSDGTLSVYELVMTRLAQMSEVNVGFEPFTGPIYDTDGNLVVKSDARMSIFELMTMEWFVGVDGGCAAVSNVGCVFSPGTST
ncbi:MAG: Purine-binding protein precursor [Candidatus Heimdallarchaeota archaeon LC_2]|nr:MAG: Purine-binding protein precursor [Candidatus Heimdallarchaeota archaeon LC_2]